MGGMAAQIPIKHDQDANELAMNKVKKDKEREANAGHDGTWIAHPGLSRIAINAFNEVMPNDKPNKEPLVVFPKAIVTMPIAAIIMANQTFNEIFSFKNKKPSKAVINGIAAKQSNVIAALVFVIDQIKVIIAIPSPKPPIIPENPILK